MDTRRPTTTNEAQALIIMLQNYSDICTRRSHILAPPTEAAIGPKGKKIRWNDSLEESFKEKTCMVPTKVLLIYKDWTITFMVNNDASDKKLGDVISQNNKPITLF